jgi:hypothetical protein
MSSLKQRIDAAARSFVLEILEVVRTTPVHELERLLARPEAAPPPRKKVRAARKPPESRRWQQRPAEHPAPPSHDAFDVTSPELLLVAELQGKAMGGGAPPNHVTREAVPAAAPHETEATQDVRSSPAAAHPMPAQPPAVADPRSALRPGESLARADGAGIVIRREGRSKRR